MTCQILYFRKIRKKKKNNTNLTSAEPAYCMVRVKCALRTMTQVEVSHLSKSQNDLLLIILLPNFALGAKPTKLNPHYC